MTRSILKENPAPIIVSCGGDGTNNEVINGFIENDALINPKAKLAFLPVGSGNDFSRTLRIPGSPEKRVEMIKNEKQSYTKIGKVFLTEFEGQEIKRYFINACSFGLTSSIALAINKSKKLFGAKVAYLYLSLKSIFNFKPFRVNIVYDNTGTFTGSFSNLVIANGKYMGCGLKVLPQAEILAKYFDLLLSPGMQKLKLISTFIKIPLGLHLKSAGIELHRIMELRAESENNKDVYVEVDGEILGTLPMKFAVLPEKISILVP